MHGKLLQLLGQAVSWDKQILVAVLSQACQGLKVDCSPVTQESALNTEQTACELSPSDQLVCLGSRSISHPKLQKVKVSARNDDFAVPTFFQRKNYFLTKFVILHLDVNSVQPGSVDSTHVHSCMEQLPEALPIASRCPLLSSPSENANRLPKSDTFFHFAWAIMNA